MDFDSTLSTIAAYLPGELDQMIGQASSYIPDGLRDVIWHASAYLPTELSFVSVAEFMLYFTAASLILGVLSRMVLGKRSSLNHSLSAVMGILFIYAATITVYTFNPWNLDILLSPLPFVTFAGDYLIVLPITDVQFTALCTQSLSMVILAFLVNLLDSIIPKGKRFFGWFLLRFLAIIVSMLLHFIITWAFRTYLPDVLVQYAPTILLLLLLFLVFSGLLNLILGMVLTVASPFLGAMYSFFFTNAVGKQLSKAIFSSIILCGIVFILEFFGYTVISISAASLLTYIPLAIVLMLLWYLIGHIL